MHLKCKNGRENMKYGREKKWYLWVKQLVDEFFIGVKDIRVS
jgi:hypothetical protein